MKNWKKNWADPATLTHKEIQELIDKTREETIWEVLGKYISPLSYKMKKTYKELREEDN